MKFYIIKIKIILIKKTDYSEHCLNIKVNNIYKINIHIFVHLNKVNIVKILNAYQKLSVLKENNIIIYNTINNIIYNV